MSIQSFIPKYICDIAPYQGGKPISELAREYKLEESSIVKLASNENPLGMSPKAREVILKSIDEIYRYRVSLEFIIICMLELVLPVKLEYVSAKIL